MYNFLKTYVFPIFVENFTVYTVRKRDYKFYSPVGCTVHIAELDTVQSLTPRCLTHSHLN